MFLQALSIFSFKEMILMKRFFITLTIMILITIAPFVSFVVYGESQKPAYNQTFLGELGPKFKR